MEIPCKYSYIMYDKEALYSCVINEAIFKAGKIKKFKGRNKAHHASSHVEAVWIENSIIEAFPKRLDKFFPKIKSLSVINCKLTSLSRADLVGLENLTNIYVHCSSQLTELPENLFANMKRLKEVSFLKNGIIKVSSKMLEPVQHLLEYVDFSGNPGINTFYCPHLQNSEISIEKLMEAMDKSGIKTKNEIKTKREAEAHSSVTLQDKKIVTDWKTSLAVVPKAEKVNKFDQKLQEGLKKFWETKQLADCSVVSFNITFKVHKAIISMQSPFFAKLLERPGKNNIIIDFSPQSVEEFLRFLYTKELPHIDRALEVFRIASKTGVQVLKEECETLIAGSINNVNVWSIHRSALRHNSEKLVKATFAKIRGMYPDLEIPEGLMNKEVPLKDLTNAYLDRKRQYAEADKNFENVKRRCYQALIPVDVGSDTV